MHSIQRLSLSALLLALVASGLPAGAAELTFDQSPTVIDADAVDQAYGDYIDNPEAGAFRYRGRLGLTPHIAVTYGPAGSAPSVWTIGYGDLTNVLYQSAESASALEVTLSGADGWTVVLHHFDLAAFAADFASFPVEVGSAQVLDGRGTVLFDSVNQTVSEATRTRIEFDPPLEDTQLTIRIDLSGLQALSGLSRGGNAVDAIGLDNILISEGGPTAFRDGEAVAYADGPARIALGDLDGDGDQDVLVAAYGDGGGPGGISWAENLGDPGNFGLQWTIQTGTATGVAAADIDSDGDLDAVATFDAGGKVAWYENLGGDFGDPPSNERVIATLPGATSVAVADLDRDGDLDVLTTSRSGGSVQWHRNDGTPRDGGWTDETIASLAGAPRHAAPADLDRDGDLDVLIAGETGPVFSWVENLGGGDFGEPLFNQQAIPNAALGGRFITAMDVDGDGAPDVVTASCDDDTIAWNQNRLGTPSADFGPATPISTIADCPEVLLAFDLDEDTRVDLLAASRDGAPRWFRKLDDGILTPAIPFPAAATGSTDVAAGDIDRDGDRDVAVALDGAVDLLENATIHRSARFGAGSYIDVTFGANIVRADVDRDGDADIIYADTLFVGATDFTIKVGENDGTGLFPPISTFPISGLEDLEPADLDGDGDPDLLTAHGDLSWFVNRDGAGDLSGPAIVISAGTGNLFRSAAAVDLDEDGDLDVVAGGHSGTGAVLSWFESDGTPADGGWAEHPLTVGFDRVLQVAVADLNRDGDPDIVATAGDDFTSGACATCAVIWFAGDASQQPAQFTAQTALPAVQGLDALGIIDGSKPLSIAASRDPVTFNEAGDTRQGDGDPDIAVGTDRYFTYYENRLEEPTADFAPARLSGQAGSITPDPRGPFTSMLIEDVNGDGRSDFFGLVEDDTQGNSAITLQGRNVWAPLNIGIDAQIPGGVTTIDLDSDGDLDFISSDAGGPSFFSGGPGLAIAENVGGQYVLTGSYTGSGLGTDGDLVPLLRFQATLQALIGDPSARMESLTLRVTDSSSGEPLTSVQANALIGNLHFYRESSIFNAPAFDPDTDILVATIADLALDADGLLGVAVSVGDPNLLLAAPATFYVVAEVAGGAATLTLQQITFSYVNGTFIMRDALTGSPLTEENRRRVGYPQDISKSLGISPRIEVNVDGADSNVGDLACDTGGGICTLRAAIQEANAQPGWGEILLGPGVYTLEIPGPDEDAGLTGDLDITDGLRIVGAGPDLTIIDGGGLDRVFDVHFARLELENVTVRNGSATTPDSYGTEGMGGGIRTFGELDIRNCVIRDNEAYVGGGIGVWSYQLLVFKSRITGNSAVTRGGGIYTIGQSVEISNSTIDGNVASEGGGISNDGDVHLDQNTLSGNQAIPSALGTGEGGAIDNRGSVNIARSTVTANEAVTGGGVSNCGACSTYAVIGVSIVAGNNAVSSGPDCSGTLQYTDFTLIQDVAGCAYTPGANDLVGVDPLLGPLQDNGGPTPTHALLTGSPAIDAGFACGGTVDQRGEERIDLPSVPNAASGDGCSDIGAYEFSLVDALDPIEVPVRWCVLEGSPSFDFQSPNVQEEINAVLQERLAAATDNIYDPQSRIRFRSAATSEVPNFPILPDNDTSVGSPGDVAIDPPARDYEEFLQLIADCRVAWEAIDPSITGITAVNINLFTDPAGNPVDVLGIGGRADFGNVAQQLDAGRVMVVDRVYRRSPNANPEDLIERVLAHEIGHAAGSLRHGDGVDNDGDLPQCDNGILDDDDDRCEEQPRFDGDNLMQYRVGIDLTGEQIFLAREHILRTIPDVQGDVESSTVADAARIDEEFANVLDFEFANVLDFEFANVLDFEFANVLDFEFANVLDFDEAEILDFEFANVLDFGMNFSITDPVTNDGETIVYAAVAGLPWPTPLRPPTTYLWYLDLDENPEIPGSGDLTGGLPVDHGFPGGSAADPGVDVIVMLEIFSECDLVAKICSDSVVQTAFVFDPVAGYQIALGPEAANDAVQAVTVGLVQAGTDPEREDQALSVVLAPRLPNSLLINAVPGYQPGDPVAMTVVTAIPCGTTLPDGTVVDCQCTDCAVCPDYPGCEVAGGEPEKFKICSDGVTACATDTDCDVGDLCGGDKLCSSSGVPCLSNLDCTGGETDACGGAALLPTDEPETVLSFEAPVLPSCVADPAVVTTRGVTVSALDFPVGTGRAMRVFLDGEFFHVEPAPVFDPITGRADLAVVLPSGTLFGEALLAVELEAFATTAVCSIYLAIEGGSDPAVVEPVEAPLDPTDITSAVEVSASFTDEPGDQHTAEWDWGDGTTSAGTVTEPSGTEPGTVTGSREYDEPGVYTVSLTLHDDFGNITEQASQFIVMFDPDGGFVTGGGFIDSPPGAYAPDPPLVGKAHFGFVAKYVNDEPVPTGNTEFNIRVAGLNFKSGEYQWLIVEGHNAQFTGTGQIDGAGSYGFMLTAVDEKLTESRNVDGLRIRIWDMENGDAIVYDNQAGQEELGEAATDLAGGSIVIHNQ